MIVAILQQDWDSRLIEELGVFSHIPLDATPIEFDAFKTII
jgi:hypothetical protein